MKSTSFLLQLRELNRAKGELETFGFSSDDAEHFSCMFAVPEVEPRATAEEHPLISLVNDHLSEELEIGQVSLGPEITPVEGGWVVGHLEIHPIFVCQQNGAVQVRDEEDLNRVTFACAVGEERFLDALLIFAKYLAEALVDVSKRRDESYRCAVARSCADAAGGDMFLPFFAVLLNCRFKAWQA